jgi:hypothetical protein
MAVVALRPRLRRIWRETLVLLGYALFSVAVTGLWNDPTRFFLAGEDPTIDTWTLMRVTHNLLSQPLDPFVGNLAYPEPHSVLFADPLFSLALLVTPLRALTSNAAVLYNTALLCTLTLAGYGFYRLALRVSGHPGAALFAGIIVPFMPQQMHRLYLGSLTYVSIGGLALLTLSLISLLDRPSLATGLRAAGAFFLQASIGGYWALFSTLIALLVAAWGWRSLRSLQTWKMVTLAVAVAGLLLLPYLSGFLEVHAAAETNRGGAWPEMLSTDLGVHPFCSYAYTWGRLLPEPSVPGGRLFPGVLALIFAGIGLARCRDRYTGLLLLLGGVFFILSLGPHLHIAGRSLAPMPFLWLKSHVPLFGTMRTPITFVVISLAALVVMAARGIASSAVGRRPWLVALILVGGALEVLAPLPRLDTRGDPRKDVYAFLAQQPRGGVLEAPVTIDAYPAIRWASAVHDLPMVNIGGFGFTPRWWSDLERLVRKEWYVKPAHQNMQDWRSTRLLRQLPARYLVLRPGISGYLTSHVEATPETFAALCVTADGYRVYRVRRGDVGPRMRRRFGDDELKAGPLIAWFRGPTGTHLDVRLNDHPLGPQILTPTWQRSEWRVDPHLIRRGTNELLLSVQGPDLAQGSPTATVPSFELYDIGNAANIAHP